MSDHFCEDCLAGREAVESGKGVRMAVKIVIGVVAGLIVLFFLFPTVMVERGSVPQERRDVVHLAVGLEAYKDEYGEFPAGEQAVILQALFGKNPRKIVFYEVSPKRLNSKGEMADRWGTPYRIEIDAKTYRPHVSSAGKDRIFEPEKENADDIRSWE